jgi:group II intron reverse transcriptase/maturase
MEQNTATKLIRITQKAKEISTYKFISLKYLINEAYLFDCFHELKAHKAAGVDGKTLESYTDAEMKQTIQMTITQMKENHYRPQPVRRVLIPKANGKTRPLGIPTVIDKVVQLGIAKILEAIFEPTFLTVSYGYRPGKNPHDCLKEINHMVMGKPVNYILEADIEGFFDHVDHAWMRKCLEVRIKDQRFINLIVSFLKAGVMEDHQVKPSSKGTPQGGIISPILANIYLHYVLDLWFTKKMQKTHTGYSQLIRYADDFIVGFQIKTEALQFRQNLKQRLEEFNLKLAEEKTELIEFGRYAEENIAKRRKDDKSEGQGKGKPPSFDFLGFTHYCGHTKDGRFAIKVKTSHSRFTRSIQSMEDWLKQVRSCLNLQEIWDGLDKRLRGHYQYYGVSGNFDSILTFHKLTRRLTFKWLNRRSQKKSWNWEQFDLFTDKYQLPRPKLTYNFYNTYA